MNNDWQKDYPSHQELNEKDLDDNSSLKKMLRLVGEGKRVIDFGCATGYFSQLLAKKGCTVTGVEINPEAAKFAEQYCEQVIVADLDFVSVTAILPKQAFDVAVFGDVLEHLRNPWKVVSEIRQLLKPEGYVVASIPNIAHGAIRLALLQGRFEYMDLGLLDNTHLRFFTRKSVEELFEGAGYFVETIERTKLPVISASTWVPRIDKNTFDPKIIEQIEQAAEADTFQFVVRAFPLSDNGKYAALKAQNAQLVLELEQAQSQLHQSQTAWEQIQTQLHQTQVAWEQAQSQVHQTQAVLEQTQTQLHETQVAWEQAQSQLHETQVAWEQIQSHNHHLQAELMQCLEKVSKTQFQLQEKQTEIEQFQSQLQQTHTQAQQMQETIVAMQSSKFWKSRTFWFRFKKPFLRNS